MEIERLGGHCREQGWGS